MRVAEAEEEEKRRKEIAATKQVPICYVQVHVAVSIAYVLYIRQRRSYLQRQRTPSLATARNRVDRHLTSRSLHCAHTIHIPLPCVCVCRQELEDAVFSRHHNELKEKKISQLQEKLQARRKGGMHVHTHTHLALILIVCVCV